MIVITCSRCGEDFEEGHCCVIYRGVRPDRRFKSSAFWAPGSGPASQPDTFGLPWTITEIGRMAPLNTFFWRLHHRDRWTALVAAEAAFFVARPLPRSIASRAPRLGLEDVLALARARFPRVVAALGELSLEK